MGMSAGKCNHLSPVAVIMIDDNWLFSGRYDVAADKLLLIFLWVNEIERLFRQGVIYMGKE